MSTESKSKFSCAYEKMLALGKEAIAEVQRPFKVNAAKLDAQKELNTLESEVANLEVEISEKKSTFPVNMGAVLDMQDKLALKVRRRDNMKALFAELFETPVQG